MADSSFAGAPRPVSCCWIIVDGGAQATTILITKPEVEALVYQLLQTGAFKDAEDVVWQALHSSTPQSGATAAKNAEPAKNMVDLFAPLRGLNIDFHSDRSEDTDRDIDP